jgi:hypothetical protein
VGPIRSPVTLPNFQTSASHANGAMILGLIGGATTLGAGLLTLLFSYFPRKAQSLIGAMLLKKSDTRSAPI